MAKSQNKSFNAINSNASIELKGKANYPTTSHNVQFDRSRRRGLTGRRELSSEKAVRRQQERSFTHQ
jgi:hypothetical protein